jgi:hypothetical protein
VAVLTDIPEGCNLGKGITGPEATVIATATLSDGQTYDVIFVYEKGAALPVAPADGSAQVAADIRIGIGFHASCFPALGDNYYALLGAAVDYALGLTGPVVDMEIGFAAQPPVIDGEVDGIWADASTQNIIPVGDPADASGSWQALYDSENLYVIADISDESLMNDSGAAYLDDSVEFYFDGGNTKDGPPLSGNNRQYTFGWTADDIQGVNQIIEGVEHAQVDTDTGWRIEIKLPWLSLQDTEPQAGDLIGIDSFYNDDDDGGDTREDQIWTFATDGSAWEDASQWGTAVLAAEPPAGPVGYWKLDDGEGAVAVDSSGGGNDGIIQNADAGGLGDGGSVWIDDPERGMVISFNGDDSGAYVSTDLIIPFMSLESDFTWAFWAKQHADQETNNDLILGNRYGGTEAPLQFIKFTPTRFEFFNDDYDYLEAVNYEPVPSDVWAHHVTVKDGTSLTYYRNGVEAGTSTITKTIDPNPFSMGGDATNVVEMWRGYLSDVRIYDRALSADEISRLVGPVAYWKLDEGSGTTVVDSAGNVPDGTFEGDPQWAIGIIGGALEFDGDDWVNLGTPPDLVLTEAISISCWVNPAGFVGRQGFVHLDAGYAFKVHEEGRLCFTTPGILDHESANTILEAGTWQHVAATFKPGQSEGLIFYLNGVETERMNSSAINPGTGPFRIGNNQWNETLTGLIDDVRIYDRILSADEISELASVSGENLLQNPSFEEDEAILDDPDWVNWCTWNPAEGAGSNATIVDTEAIDGARSLRIEPKGVENWHFIVLYLSFPADVDKNYTTNFWAKAEAPRPLTVQMKCADNTIDAWGATDFDLTTDWAEYSYTSEVLIDNIKLEICCSGSEVPFWLDLVSVSEAD